MEAVTNTFKHIHMHNQFKAQMADVIQHFTNNFLPLNLHYIQLQWNAFRNS